MPLATAGHHVLHNIPPRMIPDVEDKTSVTFIISDAAFHNSLITCRARYSSIDISTHASLIPVNSSEKCHSHLTPVLYSIFRWYLKKISRPSHLECCALLSLLHRNSVSFIQKLDRFPFISIVEGNFARWWRKMIFTRSTKLHEIIVRSPIYVISNLPSAFSKSILEFVISTICFIHEGRQDSGIL